MFIFGPAAEKRDLSTYANSEDSIHSTYTNSKDPDQPVHPRSLVRIFGLHLHSIGTLLKRED